MRFLSSGALLNGSDTRRDRISPTGRTGILDVVEASYPPGWEERDGALERTFELRAFPDAIDFVNRVAALAEEADHHPDIAIHYRRVTLRLWTHSKAAITDRDVDLALRIDALDA
jgi:4a-hydroxytetrahydrobiopterin dehydratase